jgi:hypothetical protein
VSARSYLGRFQPNRVDVDAEKRTGWREHGILVLKADDPMLTWPERELVKQLGRKLYGERRVHGQ